MTHHTLYIVPVRHHGITTYHCSTTPIVNSKKFISYEKHVREMTKLSDQVIKMKKIVPEVES